MGLTQSEIKGHIIARYSSCKIVFIYHQLRVTPTNKILSLPTQVLISEELDYYSQDPSFIKVAKQELAATHGMTIEAMENMSESIFNTNRPQSPNCKLLPCMHCSNGVRTSQGQKRAWEIKVQEKGVGGLQVAEQGQLNSKLLIDEDVECVTSL